MKRISSPQDQEQDQAIIEILKNLGSLGAEYPAELFAARRAAFIVRVKQHIEDRLREELPSQDQFIQQLEGLRSVRAEYPAELLAARRAAFIAQVQQSSRIEVKEELSSKDQDLIRLLKNIKSFDPEYSPRVVSARRSAFVRQIARGGSISLLEALRSSIQSRFLNKIKILTTPAMGMMRTSLVVAILMIAAFLASLVGNREQMLSPAPSQEEISQPGPILAPTNTREVARVICKPGYIPPLCLAQEFDNGQDLTFQGNGSARPAVAKDTIPGYSGVHKPAYVNDGLYGPGASWISNSAYSWIKIDLGKSITINTVTFGRDRLGSFNDRDPGQFVIAVAMSDNIYADGNSNNDYVEYTDIYNSQQAGFSGIVSGSETVRAEFAPVMARFVKITFSNAGTAIDEVEVFMVQPPVLADYPTKRPKDDLPGVASTFLPTDTPLPPNTATPVPTDTPLPTDTPQPTDTPIPVPTDTPVPTEPPPTDTPLPPPTDVPTVVPIESETPFFIGGP